MQSSAFSVSQSMPGSQTNKHAPTQRFSYGLGRHGEAVRMYGSSLGLDPAATTVMAEPQIYTIFCLVVGDNNPFSVKIAKNETVNTLQDMIKEKQQPKLNNITASDLKLYQVEIAGDDNMANNVTQKMSEGLCPLNAMKKLEYYFPGTPREEAVHILVQAPGKYIKPPFVVPIATHSFVAHL